MTDEEINKAIAEACGFVFRQQWQSNEDEIKFTFWYYPENWMGPDLRPCAPAFCLDLNAMQEACESVFSESNAWSTFVYNLSRIICAGHYSDYDILIMTNRATARQRAEAFLKTIGKWKD